MTIDLINKINGLTREQAMEAAEFISQSLVGDEPVDQNLPAVQKIAAEPYRHLPDVECLSRLILIGAASTEKGAEEVERAISGTGKKQVILGGVEIVALAALGVVALRIIVTRGRGRSEQTFEILDKAGKPSVKIKNIEEPISITEDLATIVKGALGGGPQGKQGK
jgi:hypothetical protein